MNNSGISFETTKEEFDIIAQIVSRAAEFYSDMERIVLAMDITAAHENGCPLKLGELLAAPDSDFFHDIAGITRHINRETGELEDFFLPRYADNQTEGNDG